MRELGVRSTIYDAVSETARSRLSRLSGWSTTGAAKRAQRKLGWSDVHRRAVEREYRRFMALIAIDPATSYGMAPCEVDELWHEHLMDTRDYLSMCDTVFGMVVHHCPIAEGKPHAGDEDPYLAATLPRLRETFGVRPGRIWPKAGNAAGFSQCCEHVSGDPHSIAA
jgi:hypothetical protein